MPSVRCRKCGQAVNNTADSCPECGARPPFACSVCSRALSAYALNVKRSTKYPYGSFSPDGLPVCYEHRQVRCYLCSNLFEQRRMRRRRVGKRADTVLRKDMAPRIEDVFGSFCPECDRKWRRSGGVKGMRLAKRTRTTITPQVALMIVAGFVLSFLVLTLLILNLMAR